MALPRLPGPVRQSFGRRVGAGTSKAKCQEMHGLVYHLNQSASKSVSHLLNQSARHKLAAPFAHRSEILKN